MVKKIKQRLYNSFFSLSSLRKNASDGPIFIVGTGRSGTHFLCSCLNKFSALDDVFSGRESPYMFHEISKLVVHQKKMPSYVIGYYSYMAKKVRPKLFLDQTHPNIWNVEQLLNEFPRAKFLAISRDVRSVVYSMKMHEGVSRWIEDYDKYPVPNSFLGISDSSFEVYKKDLTNLQRAVFRWCSHEQRIRDLKYNYPDSVMRICYEDLSDNMESVMGDVAMFLGVPKPESFVEFNGSSISKKDSLTSDELTQIDKAIDIYYKHNSDDCYESIN